MIITSFFDSSISIGCSPRIPSWIFAARLKRGRNQDNSRLVRFKGTACKLLCLSEYQAHYPKPSCFPLDDLTKWRLGNVDTVSLRSNLLRQLRTHAVFQCTNNRFDAAKNNSWRTIFSTSTVPGQRKWVIQQTWWRLSQIYPWCSRQKGENTTSPTSQKFSPIGSQMRSLFN